MSRVPSRCQFIWAAIVMFCLAVPGNAEAQSYRVTRGPYLQQGTESGIVVRWRSNASTDSVVRYGTSRRSLGRTARRSGSRRNHEVALSGLRAGTRYYYSVGNSAEALSGGDASTYFETAPAVGSTAPARIWVIGDAGTANSNAARVYDAYRDFAGGNYTSLWLMLGDNAYNDGTDSEYQRAVFDMYPELLRQTVVWPTLGNHDGKSADSDRESGPYYDIFTLPRRGEAGGLASGTEAYYAYDYGNIHFVVLDSYDTNRGKSGAMLRWLEADLQQTDADWLIAYWHHPPYTKGSHNSDSESALIDMRQNALPILESYGVDLVLTGHSHSYERSFLIDGHYGKSGSLRGRMIVNGGDGRRDGNGAYTKATEGLAPHEGAVYAVAGSSGKTSSGSLNHPAMFISLRQLGSMVLDVDGLTLDAKFLNDRGRVVDYFSLVKGDGSSCQVTESSESSCSDGLDNDCDGVVDGADSDCCRDADGDGYSASSCGGSDCDDADSAVGPGARELCGDDVDNDCNGRADCADLACSGVLGCCADKDGDGYAALDCGGDDCNDSQAAMYPGATELCSDGMDNDCDGAADCSDGSCGSAPVCNSGARTVLLTDVSDAYVRKDRAGNNYGNSASLEIDTASSFKHTLIKPNNLGGIAAGSRVVSAELVLRVFDSGDRVRVREVQGTWRENAVSWNNAPALGAEFASFSAGSTGEVSVDVTALVQAWVNGRAANGIDLYPSDDNGVDIRSSEYGTSSERPYFVVEVAGRTVVCEDGDGDGYTAAVCGGADCDDSDANVNPGAVEVCGDGLDNDCDGAAAPCTGNLPPRLLFVAPSATPDTADLGVVIDASDPDGRVTQILLYIDGNLVRMERARPYEWGTANSNQTDSTLRGLSPGRHELRAVATDDGGATATASLVVQISDGGPVACNAQLLRGERLVPGQWLCSSNRAHTFGLTEAGELLLRSGSRTVWSANTDGSAARLNMQGDGNLVTYDASSRPLWSSKTAGRAGATLTLQDSGRSEVRLAGSVLWSVGGDPVPPPPPPPTGEIQHLGATQVWDSNGQDLRIQRVAGTRTGDLLVLALHRTDDDLPLTVDGWTRVAECYKRSNGYDCSTARDCTRWQTPEICGTFGDRGGAGHDLAQAIFVRTVQSGEPSSYRFDLNQDSSGSPGWAILIGLRGADNSNPVRDWSFKGCDGSADSLFPSVYGERGDMVLLSQSFDDAIAQSRFRAPAGLRTLGYVSNSDEAGFLFGGTLKSTGETGVLRTGGDGGPDCKDGLVSLTVRPR